MGSSQPSGGAAGAASAPLDPTPSEPTPGASGDGSGENGAAPSGGPGSAGSTGMLPGEGDPDGSGAAGSGGTAAASGGTAGASSTDTSEPPGFDPADLPGGGSPPLASSASCSAFTACGGDVSGSWVYTSACRTEDAGALAVVCPTVTLVFEPGEASTLSFSAGQVVRNGAPLGDAVFTFPADCMALTCASIAAVLSGNASCSAATGDCICRTPSSVAWSQQPYTVSGTQLTLQDGRTFDYCVTGDQLVYRETGSATEPGVFTLQRL